MLARRSEMWFASIMITIIRLVATFIEH
jgi:hypothetical protein